MPALFDLVWKPSAAQSELPNGVYPILGPAVYRGQPYDIHYTLMDGATPYVPTGILLAQIRPARLKASAIVGDPLAEFVVTLGGVDGNEVFQGLVAEDTLALPDAWFWDIQEFDGDDPLGTWFTGKGKAWGDITREAVGS